MFKGDVTRKREWEESDVIREGERRMLVRGKNDPGKLQTRRQTIAV